MGCLRNSFVVREPGYSFPRSLRPSRPQTHDPHPLPRRPWICMALRSEQISLSIIVRLNETIHGENLKSCLAQSKRWKVFPGVLLLSGPSRVERNGLAWRRGFLRIWSQSLSLSLSVLSFVCFPPCPLSGYRALLVGSTTCLLCTVAHRLFQRIKIWCSSIILQLRVFHKQGGTLRWPHSAEGGLPGILTELFAFSGVLHCFSILPTVCPLWFPSCPLSLLSSPFYYCSSWRKSQVSTVSLGLVTFCH